MMIRIRQAAVAGSFYPDDPDELRAEVRRLLDSVPPPPAAGVGGPAPRALIVPHAGYVYSGPVAAAAYARLRPYRRHYRRVVLLGPCHYVGVRGIAASAAERFRTPLGDVPLDTGAVARLQRWSVSVVDGAHRPEHSLEVQLPFLQTVLEAFTLLPLAVGDADPADIAGLIEEAWADPSTLVVVSTDLSHFLAYAAAGRLDRGTCSAIEVLDGNGIGHGRACGATPLRGLLLAARRSGLRAITLDLRNSGDTAGGRDRVVGYGAWMLVESESCNRAA